MVKETSCVSPLVAALPFVVQTPYKFGLQDIWFLGTSDGKLLVRVHMLTISHSSPDCIRNFAQPRELSIPHKPY